MISPHLNLKAISSCHVSIIELLQQSTTTQ